MSKYLGLGRIDSNDEKKYLCILQSKNIVSKGRQLYQNEGRIRTLLYLLSALFRKEKAGALQDKICINRPDRKTSREVEA